MKFNKAFLEIEYLKDLDIVLTASTHDGENINPGTDDAVYKDDDFGL